MDAEEASPHPRMDPSDVSSEDSRVSGVMASQGSFLGHSGVRELIFGSGLSESHRLIQELSTPLPEIPSDDFDTPVDGGQCTLNESTLTMDELENSVPQGRGVKRSSRRRTIVPLPMVAEESMDDTLFGMPDSSYRQDDPTYVLPSNTEMSEAHVVATPNDVNVLGNKGIR